MKMKKPILRFYESTLATSKAIEDVTKAAIDSSQTEEELEMPEDDAREFETSILRAAGKLNDYITRDTNGLYGLAVGRLASKIKAAGLFKNDPTPIKSLAQLLAWSWGASTDNKFNTPADSESTRNLALSVLNRLVKKGIKSIQQQGSTAPLKPKLMAILTKAMEPVQKKEEEEEKKEKKTKQNSPQPPAPPAF